MLEPIYSVTHSIYYKSKKHQ